jgi:osmotically inducible lipoprotein OsmE
MNFEINRLVCCALFVIALGISACASTIKPESVMSLVHPGMTRDDVVNRIGPPDHLYGSTGNDCLEYSLGDDGKAPFAVYLRGDIAVTAVQANCRRAF